MSEEKEKALADFSEFCLRPLHIAENTYRIKENHNAHIDEDKTSRKRGLGPSPESYKIRPPVVLPQSNGTKCSLGLTNEDLSSEMHACTREVRRKFNESLSPHVYPSSISTQPLPPLIALHLPQPPIAPPPARDSNAKPNPRTQRLFNTQSPPPNPPMPTALPPLQHTPQPPSEPAPPALPRPVRRGFLSSLRPGFLRGR